MRYEYPRFARSALKINFLASLGGRAIYIAWLPSAIVSQTDGRRGGIYKVTVFDLMMQDTPQL